MEIKKAVGRPTKVDYRIMIKIADSIQHNASITEACRYAGVSKDTYYRYFNNCQVFSEHMIRAKQNQTKLVFSFLTMG